MELLQVFNLIESTEIFIKSSLQSDISDGHDFDHTCRVVKHALALGGVEVVQELGGVVLVALLVPGRGMWDLSLAGC